ncbi:hypothetical protein HYQ46_000527 [Verticillium longisporum]|nr:hypothetical protein HYQ46_000527 [Verticillium longisporum]
MIAGTYLEYIMWDYDPSIPAVCELRESSGDKETLDVALRDGTASVILMCFLYMNAMRSIRLEDENDTSTPRWLLTIMCSIYRELNPKHFTSQVDTSSLFEFSFGQVMPLLLLLVFALTALEVGSIIEPIHKEAQMPDALAARGFGLETRVNTLTTEEGNPASTPRYQSVVEAAREKRKVAFYIALLVSVIQFVGVLLLTYFCFPYSVFVFGGFLLLSHVWKTVRQVIFIRRFRVAYLKLEISGGH